MLQVTAAILLVLSVAMDCHVHKDTCLIGGIHKPLPSPESEMQECTLYSKSSCCHANFTEQLAHSPVLKVEHMFWNRCGNVSRKCEMHMKKLECFYQCSPHAAHWMSPNSTMSLLSVPLCNSFCEDWFEACKEDFTCTRNWLQDWDWNTNNENVCKGNCIPYKEMYANATDLCENMWGPSFEVGSSTCRCLQMNERDEKIIKYIIESSSSESSSSSSDSSSSEERACQRKLRRLEKEAAEGAEKRSDEVDDPDFFIF
ncbi:riboflavin-binding protein-like [Protopterus annectens]|uniref:riboflavin-binding protein-like n=1 Tax=Protopterus annectens TaxID=7888 RepID=UPI001CF93545|nr:riboflavin-binding protein-like [Protopterus annectens]